MALSKVTYAGVAALQDYTITFPFLKQAHVSCFVDSVATTDFTIVGTTLTITTPAIAGGEVIEIIRTTPNLFSEFVVSFADGSALPAASLNTAVKQNLYITQELIDRVDDVEKASPAATVQVDAQSLNVDTSGTWFDDVANVLDLSNLVEADDTLNDITLAGNDLTLKAGKYLVEVSMDIRQGSAAVETDVEFALTTAASSPTVVFSVSGVKKLAVNTGGGAEQSYTKTLPVLVNILVDTSLNVRAAARTASGVASVASVSRLLISKVGVN